MLNEDKITPTTISLKDFFWLSIRRSIFLSWGGLLLAALIIYGALVGAMKLSQLKSRLNLAAVTVENSVAVGDWDLALSVLKANVDSGVAFRLILKNPSNGIAYAGPLGAEPFGLFSICRESQSIHSIQLSGCTKIVAAEELLSFSLFVFVSILISFFSFIHFRRSALLLLEKFKYFLADGLEVASSNIFEIETIRSRISGLMLERSIATKERALGELAAKVAHDIRSPLNVLRMVVNSFDGTEVERQALINAASQRIQDIAKGLLNRYRANSDTEESRKPVVLKTIIENIVSEKKTFLRGRGTVFLKNEIPSTLVSLAAEADGSELAAILSNVINNSLEAIECDGEILIALADEMGMCKISVKDNGRGIPESLLNKVGQKGITFGKAEGLGLGLYNARTILESWGGELEIVSMVGVGTTVTLWLKKARLPDGHLDRVENLSKALGELGA